MMKRVLIACYLVLCAYFSFAQGGEVVLEIPIKLGISSMWNTIPISGNIIANEDKSKYALLLRDSEDFHLFLLNQNFQNDDEFNLPNQSREFRKYANFLEGFFIGNEYYFFFTNDNKTRFKMLTFNTDTENIERYEIPLFFGFNGNGDDYIQSFQIEDKYYFMTVASQSPIIKFFSIGKDKKVETIAFNLNKDFPKKELKNMLNLDKKEVIKVDESTHIDLATGVANNKLYLQGDKVVMSMANPSKVLTFDLSSKTHEVKNYQTLPITIFEEEDSQKNMLIHKDKIYQIGVSKSDFTFSIKTLQDSILYKYRLQNSSTIGDITIRNDNFQQADSEYGITQNTALTTKQFLNKIGSLDKRSGISFVINELDSGQVILSIGATKIITEVRGGMVSGNMGMGGAPNMIMMGGRDAGYQSIFFDALFDEKSGQPIKKNIDNEAYIAFRTKLSLQKKTKNTHAITTIKTKDGYLLGYYDTNTENKTKPERYVFVFFKK
jgi:hypothetical protein